MSLMWVSRLLLVCSLLHISQQYHIPKLFLQGNSRNVFRQNDKRSSKPADTAGQHGQLSGSGGLRSMFNRSFMKSFRPPTFATSDNKITADRTSNSKDAPSVRQFYNDSELSPTNRNDTPLENLMAPGPEKQSVNDIKSRFSFRRRVSSSMKTQTSADTDIKSAAYYPFSKTDNKARKIVLSSLQHSIQEFQHTQQALEDQQQLLVNSTVSTTPSTQSFSLRSLSRLLGDNGDESSIVPSTRWFRQSTKLQNTDLGTISALTSHRAELAISAAQSVNTTTDANEYLRGIGLTALLTALKAEESPDVTHSSRLTAFTALHQLTRFQPEVCVEIAECRETVSLFCDLLERPSKGFTSFRSQLQRDREIELRHEALTLVQRMVRSSDRAVAVLRHNTRLRRILASLIISNRAEQHAVAANETTIADVDITAATELLSRKQIKKAEAALELSRRNNTVVTEYRNLTLSQMARVAVWGLGGVEWAPKQPNQKGLRILSFDGGGTRGVLTIAQLKELWQQMGLSYDTKPCEVFDIICGTSTGGILAALLGIQRRSLAETEAVYDQFIDRVFGQRSSLKLLTAQAMYDEREIEKILYSMCGDHLLLDSNQHRDTPRVFFVSTKVNRHGPGVGMLWRNYNYPPSGPQSRHPGSFRVNTYTAVRATSAAPTFFTPVMWEGSVYVDGALVANNPTAIAVQEAKLLYPGVPIELVLSLGSGRVNRDELNALRHQQKKAQSVSRSTALGWDRLVSQLIASSTDTEDVHQLLREFLPKDRYFRFNPPLDAVYAIDEKNKEVLNSLKGVARRYVQSVERDEESAKSFQQLVKILRPRRTTEAQQ